MYNVRDSEQSVCPRPLSYQGSPRSDVGTVVVFITGVSTAGVGSSFDHFLYSVPFTHCSTDSVLSFINPYAAGG